MTIALETDELSSICHTAMPSITGPRPCLTYSRCRTELYAKSISP